MRRRPHAARVARERAASAGSLDPRRGRSRVEPAVRVSDRRRQRSASAGGSGDRSAAATGLDARKARRRSVAPQARRAARGVTAPPPPGAAIAAAPTAPRPRRRLRAAWREHGAESFCARTHAHLCFLFSSAQAAARVLASQPPVGVCLPVRRGRAGGGSSRWSLVLRFLASLDAALLAAASAPTHAAATQTHPAARRAAAYCGCA